MVRFTASLYEMANRTLFAFLGIVRERAQAAANDASSSLGNELVQRPTMRLRIFDAIVKRCSQFEPSTPLRLVLPQNWLLLNEKKNVMINVVNKDCWNGRLF